MPCQKIFPTALALASASIFSSGFQALTAKGNMVAIAPRGAKGEDARGAWEEGVGIAFVFRLFPWERPMLSERSGGDEESRFFGRCCLHCLFKRDGFFK